jgi:NADPH2:quinone reductase
MTTPPTPPTSTRELRSLVTSAGILQLSLVDVPLAPPEPTEVIVRVEATPLNPSDLGLLLAAADLATAVAHPDGSVTAAIPPAAMRAFGARVDKSMAVGNEGAGTVVAAGSAPAAQALLGKVVAAVGGAMYSTYRKVDASSVRVLPAGCTARDGASAFVNPLTALGFVDTMKREGHTAIVHTAAASNLGQMVNRLCLADGVPLVNIVRRREHVELLRGQGAKHVLDSSTETFTAELVDAIAATGATLAFDAIGGGTLASQILTAMEIVAGRVAKSYSRYGSSTNKQVYIYGMLDRGPTTLTRNFGMTWNIGGWLVFPMIAKSGPKRMLELGDRVMAELTTTFASAYSHEITLAQALDLATMRAYARAATGEKYLICPARAD